MASSRGTSNGPDWRDIALAMEAFEAQEDCRLSITLCSAIDKNGCADLIMQAQALRDGEGLEVITLASASVTCSGTHPQTLDGALFRLMYALDFQSAANEYLRTK